MHKICQKSTQILTYQKRDKMSPIIISGANFFAFSVSFQIERDQEFGEQEACDENVVCFGAGVFLLLDAIVCDKHIDNVLWPGCLWVYWLHHNQFPTIISVLFELLQSNYVLLHECQFPTGVCGYIQRITFERAIIVPSTQQKGYESLDSRQFNYLGQQCHVNAYIFRESAPLRVG